VWRREKEIKKKGRKVKPWRREIRRTRKMKKSRR
jgi:hypothetical protein